ncbi:LysM peptidoglycan-binding domain-containing protein [Aeromicrobium sp. CTD01-1L150]|uniref:LysM peptidoglycan-binding domain-containing protein n=1 Tax=Aeromicrobium sp. CTD01-1L150 TaxID=3341830 RepID=UPI0035C16347
MLSRTGRLAAVIALLSVTFTAPRCGAAMTAINGQELDAALTGFLELGWLALSVWVLLAVGLGTLRGMPGHVGRTLLPTAVRAVVFTGITGAALAGPAHANDSSWPLDGLQLPERTTVVTDTAASRAPAPSARPTTITVRAGDSLWSLSRSALGTGASDAALAHHVRQLYRANRDVIGADPDVVHPGQRLRLPETSQESR